MKMVSGYRPHRPPDQQSALAAPFPSDEQLKNDLTPLPWENLDANSAEFLDVKGRAIVIIFTPTR